MKAKNPDLNPLLILFWKSLAASNLPFVCPKVGS